MSLALKERWREATERDLPRPQGEVARSDGEGCLALRERWREATERDLPRPQGEVARSDGEGFVYKKHIHSWLFIISFMLFYGRVMDHKTIKELQS